MIRRRRPQREIAFSFDSFLDVVANVVGIILRLILVAWVGARSYKAIVAAPPPPAVVAEADAAAALPEPTDPLAADLPKEVQALARAEAQWQDKVRQGEELEQQAAVVKSELAAAEQRRKQLEAEETARTRAAGAQTQAQRVAAATSIADVNESMRKVQNALAELKKAPSQKQTLRYRTPISQPLQTEELMFECRGGRVAVIDIGTLLDKIRQGMRDKSDLLRSQWQVEDDTTAVGAFRVHYVVERQRGEFEGIAGIAPVGGRTSFSYNVTSWQVVPVDPSRGETADRALTPGSAFRKVIDAIEPTQTAVTFWVYPDSFALYRRLRDVLHDHDITVAGRPLPEGQPISFSSKHGSLSRGQ